MLTQLLPRATGILFRPLEEWDKIDKEAWTPKDLLMRYALVLAAIPPIAGFIGYSLVGVSVMGFTLRVPVGNALLWMVLQYGLSLVGVVVVGLILDALAPVFGGERDLARSLKLVVFSWTAYWVGGVFQMVPALAMLGMLAGIYSLVLLYFGMKAARTTPADKLVGHFVVTLVCGIVVFAAIGFLVGAIALPSLGSL